MSNITKFKRLDKTIVDNGLVATIERAHELIQNGAVYVNGAPITSVLCPINEDHQITISGIDCPWVSQEAIRLFEALDQLKIDVKGRIAVDLGSGAGGFTEVLLQRGIKKVYAVDKDSNLLHSSLILNPRVKNLHKSEARDLKPESFQDAFDLIVADTGPENYEEILTPVLTSALPALDLLIFADTKDTAKNLERWLRLEMKCLLKKVPDSLHQGGHLIWAVRKA